MHRRQHVLGEVGLEEAPAFPSDSELLPEQGLRGDCTEADEDSRPDELELAVKPGLAGR